MKKSLIAFAIASISASGFAEEAPSEQDASSNTQTVSDKTTLYLHLGFADNEEVDEQFDIDHFGFYMEVYEEDHGNYSLLRGERTEAAKLYDDLAVVSTDYKLSYGQGYDLELTSVLSGSADVSGGIMLYDSIWANDSQADAEAGIGLFMDGRAGVRFDKNFFHANLQYGVEKQFATYEKDISHWAHARVAIPIGDTLSFGAEMNRNLSGQYSVYSLVVATSLNRAN